ncbi:UNVERIFIED_CONTAM: hypothetical protein HDU68_002221 [Siphonaria sp. JEL0065]|nr:hypothetical protein HDU68_002221 [Siphonaria sp. JEL0065]
MPWKIAVAVAAVAFIRFGPTKEQAFMALANSPIGYYVFRSGLKKKTKPHVVTEIVETANGIQIIPVAYGSDNYGYILHDKANDSVVLIDPADSTTFSTKMKTMLPPSSKISAILTTHHHWDHSAGNNTFKTLDPSIDVYGSGIDFPASGIINHFWHRINKQVKHMETIQISENINVKAILVPCHTRGSLIYLLDTEPNGSETATATARYAAFTGDALFVGGCGKFFEGNAKDMYNLVQDLQSELPKNTAIFPGHEYSKTNLKFALDYEPENEALQKAYENAVSKAESGIANIPSLFSAELQYNPYLRIKMSKKNGQLWQKVVRRAVSHPSLKGKMETTLNVSNGIFGAAANISNERGAETEVLGALRKLKDDYQS